MRLLIISHTPHYFREGTLVGWGATVREIDELANLFESVVHIAPLYPGPAPSSSMPYGSPRIRLRPVRPAGGKGWGQKLRIPISFPGYARVMMEERKAADVIHVRAPANISLLALVLLAVVRRPTVRWAKYAGDWSGGIGEPWSYRFQRYWLARRLHRGVVTVNGNWANQPSHITSFLNPCLTEAELAEGAETAARKVISEPVKLLFVGRLESAKGAGICLDILKYLCQAGVQAELDLIGEGEERWKFEEKARDLGVASNVRFHGGLPRSSLGGFYRSAHFVLLPSSCSEGWPKVLSEAMAYGVVPVATSISSIPEFLQRFTTGRVIASRDPQLFSNAIKSYLLEREVWAQHSTNAVRAAQQFSYGNYLLAVRKLLGLSGPTQTVSD